LGANFHHPPEPAQLYPVDQGAEWLLARTKETRMADLYLKSLESERKALWATCRLKGLPKDTPERQRIVELDALLAAHKAKTKG